MITNTASSTLDTEHFTLSKITHELRNPLTMIYSTLQLIENQHPDVKTYKHWDNLFYDVEFMIDFLAELSLYNHGDEPVKSSVSMVTFLRKIALSFAASVSDSGIEFTSHIDPDLPCVLGDRTQLKEVLFNLLRNSVDAIDPDHRKNVPGMIELDSFVQNNKLIITVSDSGCGITPQEQENIFKPFVTYKKNGTGIGLPLAQKIILAHGGTLNLTSEPGKGTTFQIALPVEQNSSQKSADQPSDMRKNVNTAACNSHI